MASRRRTIWSSVALALVVAIGMPLTAAAQFPPQGPPPYTPAADAKDLKSVLFNWTWHMGMLRGVDEHELAVTLEYKGTGTVQVSGQPCTLTSYRSSTNYQTPGQRIQYTCTRRNGQEYSTVEVVSGTFAWNEDIPGAELVEGRGKATPMPRTVQERLIRLWASPQGAAKAALAGAGVSLLAMDRNPGRLLQEGVAKIGDTSVAWEGNKPVVTFPIPGVSGATATATLDNRFMAERVVVKQGSSTIEFDYSDYNDWNNELNKIESYYAGKLVERRNGAVLRDLTTTETETGSVYVVMPVPTSVGKAPGFPLLPTDRTAALASTAETPRMDNGKPDLTGNWGAGGMNWRYGNRRCAPTQLEGCSPAWNQTLDFEFEAPSRFGPNRPLYKPEHWDKVIELDMWTNKEDPVMTCQPLGIPRQGPPRRIIQTADDIVFFYSQYGDGGGGQAEFRIIPTDGRERNERDGRETKYYGYTIGTWEGDTLVLDSTSFNDYTWLARGGFFHSDQMRVVEKLTRKGEEILYEVTVEDPVVLLEPWVMTPRILKFTASNVSEFPGFPPGLGVSERGHCEVYELEDITTQIRH
jgi:hypothetical protein